MKRISIVLAVLLIAGLFAACGVQPTSEATQPESDITFDFTSAPESTEDPHLRHNPSYWTTRDKRLMSSEEVGEIYWDATACIAKFWFLGDELSTLELPFGAVYTGYSFWEGYIFRVDNDVYAMKLEEQKLTGVKIATGVKSVIAADYRLNSDAWSNPLFVMADGSLKGYCSWGDRENPLSEKNLQEPQYEGGYFGCYYPDDVG